MANFHRLRDLYRFAAEHAADDAAEPVNPLAAIDRLDRHQNAARESESQHDAALAAASQRAMHSALAASGSLSTTPAKLISATGSATSVIGTNAAAAGEADDADRAKPSLRCQ